MTAAVYWHHLLKNVATFVQTRKSVAPFVGYAGDRLVLVEQGLATAFATTTTTSSFSTSRPGDDAAAAYRAEELAWRCAELLASDDDARGAAVETIVARFRASVVSQIPVTITAGVVFLCDEHSAVALRFSATRSARRKTRRRFLCTATADVMDSVAE